MRKYFAKRRVLKWINEYGSYQGWEPRKRIPKGQPLSSEDCPIANATKMLVDGTHLVDPNSRSSTSHSVDAVACELSHYAYAYVDAVVCELPDFVRKFIDDFDEGKYPELELYV